jgi:hypothetical protein
MEITTLIWGVIAILGFIYGLWGIRLVFDKEYAKKVGDSLRKLWGVQSTDDLSEEIYDRYTRGLPAIILGFAIVYGFINAFL